MKEMLEQLLARAVEDVLSQIVEVTHTEEIRSQTVGMPAGHRWECCVRISTGVPLGRSRNQQADMTGARSASMGRRDFEQELRGDAGMILGQLITQHATKLLSEEHAIGLVRMIPAGVVENSAAAEAWQRLCGRFPRVVQACAEVGPGGDLFVTTKMFVEKATENDAHTVTFLAVLPLRAYRHVDAAAFDALSARSERVIWQLGGAVTAEAVSATRGPATGDAD